jgi:uncharacterized protein YqeY
MYRENIDKQIASAMKSGDNVKLAVWRSIKTEFVKFQTSSADAQLTDEKELQIITKMVQQRKDSVDQYTKANRLDLAKIEQAELDILSGFLPKDPTEDDIRNIINEFFTYREQPPMMKDMRDVMIAVRVKYPTVNGGMVSKIFKEEFI